jgi:ligand-binding sensor domain-containing protein
MKSTYLLILVLFLFSCKKENNDDNKIDISIDKLLGAELLNTYPLSNMAVNSIAVDITGAKWVGTDSGMYLYKEDEFYKLSYFDGKNINSLFKSGNDILVSTSSGAYTVQVEEDNTTLADSLYNTTTGGEDNIVSVFGTDVFSKNWLGAPQGLAHFDGSNWDWNDEIRNNLGGVTNVRSMAFRENDCFFGTYGRFLYRISYKLNGTVDAITGASQMLGGANNPANNYNGELTTDTIYCVFASSDGYIWFGSETGLTRNIGSTKSQNDDAIFDYYLRGQRVLSVLETSGNKMWAGTKNGIYVQSGSEWENYNISDGIPGNIIYSIAEDLDQTIWIGTNKGISHFVGNKWVNF